MKICDCPAIRHPRAQQLQDDYDKEKITLADLAEEFYPVLVQENVNKALKMIKEHLTQHVLPDEVVETTSVEERPQERRSIIDILHDTAECIERKLGDFYRAGNDSTTIKSLTMLSKELREIFKDLIKFEKESGLDRVRQVKEYEKLTQVLLHFLQTQTCLDCTTKWQGFEDDNLEEIMVTQ